MTELRKFSREVVNLACTLYSTTKIEFNARLLNLSESGVLIEMQFNNELMATLKVGDTIKFQSIDSVDENKMIIFQETCKVVRIEATKDYIRIACEVSMWDCDYSEYIKSIKQKRE